MQRHRLTFLILLLFVATAGLALAFSATFNTHFNSGGDLSQWSTYLIGACPGQNHSVAGGAIRMRANEGTRCFGAYYRENGARPGTFPADQDVRVVWRWRYPEWGWFGTQAGQVTGAFGAPQYYGLSAVDSSVANYAHVESAGSWGSWDVTNPMWRSGARDTSWHTSTFDFICDGRQLTWWLDNGQVYNVGNGPTLAPGDPARPTQFWFGNLISDVGSSDDWTGFDLDYVYVYAVERPQMNPPAGGGGGSQTVSWNAIPNTQQPDGSTWGVQYQARACTDPNCTSVVVTSPWQNGTGYTFSGLQLNRTYSYQARARWVGAPELVTCWGNTVEAYQSGQPDLSLSKSATAQAEPGGTIQYTLIVQNPGQATASGVVVRDPIPPYITNPRSISNGGAVQGNEIVWNLGGLSAGQSRTLTWQGTVEPAVPLTVNQIVNTASANDDAGHSDQAQATTSLLKPGLALGKSAPATVWPAGTVDYRLTVQSTGNATLRQVVVRDPLPPYVLNPTNISHGGSLQGAEIVWTLGDLASGATRTLSWRGTVDPALPGDVTLIRNAATATAGSGLSAQAQATSNVGFPDLSQDKTATVEAGVGETVVYTLTVQNTGQGPAFNVVVRDPIPPYVTNPTNISAGGSVQGSEVVWSLGTLDIGQGRTLTWEGTVDLGVPASVGQIDNTATVGDDAGHSDEDGATTAVLTPAVDIFKAGPAEVGPGQAITYTLIVQNTGQMTLPQVTVRDPIPAFVLNPTGVNFGGSVEGGEIVWDIGAMTPGETVVLAWRGTIDPLIPVGVTEIRNRAAVSAWPGVEGQAETRTVVLQPDMRVSKTGTSPVRPGEAIAYRIVISNTGNTLISHIRLEDILPPYIIPTNISYGGYEVPGRIIWDNLGDLRPGQGFTVSWQGQVDPLIPPGVTVIRNLATATAGGGLTGQGETVSDLLRPGLVLEKDASATAYAGGEINYVLQLTNNGPGLARLVEVRDPVPAHTGYVPDVSPTTVAYGRLEGETVVWRLNELGPGQSVVLRWRAQVDLDLPPAMTAIENTAQATSFDTPQPVLTTATTALLAPGVSIRNICPATAQAGDGVRYEVHVENAGQGTVRQAVVRDPMPGQTSYVPGSATHGGQLAGDELVWDLGTLASGTAVDLAFELQFAPEMAANPVANVIYLTSADQPLAQSSCATTLLKPALSLTKSAPAQALADDVIEYVLTVHNLGPVVAHRAVLTDSLPAGADYLPGTASDGGQVGEGAIVWRLGDLAPGGQASRRFRAQVHPLHGGSKSRIYNEAVAAADRAGPVWASATTVVPAPVLTLTKTAPAQVAPGGTITYTLSGGNAGPGLARQALLRDQVPTGLIVLEDTLGDDGYYEAGQHAVVWPLGDLAAGQMVERSFAVLAPLTLRPGSRTLDNIAFVTSSDAAPVYAQASTVISGTFTVGGEKTATPYTEPGGRIDYALRVTNGSPNVVANVTIRDPLPNFTTYITGTASLPPAFEDEGRTLVWTLGALAPGDTYEVHFALRVAEALPDWLDRVTNEAQISYSGGGFTVRAVSRLPGVTLPQEVTPTPEPPPTRPPIVIPPPLTPTATVTSTPIPPPPPGPGLTKSVSPATVQAGQVTTVTWTLGFSNPTPLTVAGLTVRDPLPTALVYLSGHASQGEIEITGDITQTVVLAHLGDVPGGGRATVTLRTLVLSDTTAGAVYTNVATYSALNTEPGPSNEARLGVEGAPILPVTGGLLDPRTPQGKVAWGGAALVLLRVVIIARRLGWAKLLLKISILYRRLMGVL